VGWPRGEEEVLQDLSVETVLEPLCIAYLGAQADSLMKGMSKSGREHWRKRQCLENFSKANTARMNIR